MQWNSDSVYVSRSISGLPLVYYLVFLVEPRVIVTVNLVLIALVNILVLWIHIL